MINILPSTNVDAGKQQQQLPGEVQPLWVAELIADEVEVALAGQTVGQQTDHLDEDDINQYTLRVNRKIL